MTRRKQAVQRPHGRDLLRGPAVAASQWESPIQTRLRVPVAVAARVRFRFRGALGGFH